MIIVGATHGATAAYRTYADQAYSEAIKYTPNVVKVYSPNATWARVKAAVAGASVVIYMGHGNGWPSPYAYDPTYSTKDGFGLNATQGAGDYNNVYYGEPYVSTLALAPGAVVILNHLCYAAGNSEPGAAEPTVSVARQRVDNYAAGFLKAGAAAVIADGHSGPVGYLRDLFTTNQSIESLWANQSNANGNIMSFPSVRTPGATAFEDPRTPTSGFYRSLVVRAATSTDDGIATGGHRRHQCRSCQSLDTRQCLRLDGCRQPVRRSRVRFGAGPGPSRRDPPAGDWLAGRRHGRIDANGAGPGPGRPIDQRLHGRHRSRAERQRRAGPARAGPRGWFVLAQWRRRCRSGDPGRPVQRIGRLDADHLQRHGRNPASTGGDTAQACRSSGIRWQAANPWWTGRTPSRCRRSMPGRTVGPIAMGRSRWTRTRRSCWRCPRLPPPSHHSLRTPTAIETRSR